MASTTEERCTDSTTEQPESAPSNDCSVANAEPSVLEKKIIRQVEVCGMYHARAVVIHVVSLRSSTLGTATCLATSSCRKRSRRMMAVSDSLVSAISSLLSPLSGSRGIVRRAADVQPSQGNLPSPPPLLLLH